MSPPRFKLPDGLTPDEERAILSALERYFLPESPHVQAWVLAGRMALTGQGAIQSRRLTDSPWRPPAGAPFSRRGLAPTLAGRGDAR